MVIYQTPLLLVVSVLIKVSLVEFIYCGETKLKKASMFCCKVDAKIELNSIPSYQNAPSSIIRVWRRSEDIFKQDD